MKIKTKKETDSVRIVSVRTTGFEKASVGKGDAEVVDIEAIKETGQFIQTLSPTLIPLPE